MRYEYEWNGNAGSRRRPTVGIVTVNDATKGLEHRLEAQRTIKDREDTLPEGVVEPANTVAAARLRWSHQDDRRCRIDPAQQLKDPMAGRPWVSFGVHGHL